MQTPENQPAQPEGRLKRISNWFANIFSGRDYHYYGYRSQPPNFLLRHTLDRFFGRVNVSPRRLAELQQLAEKGIVVYALKYRSHLGFSIF